MKKEMYMCQLIVIIQAGVWASLFPVSFIRQIQNTKQKIVRFLPNNFWTRRQHSGNVFLREYRCVILSILSIQCYTEYLFIVKLGLPEERRKESLSGAWCGLSGTSTPFVFPSYIVEVFSLYEENPSQVSCWLELF